MRKLVIVLVLILLVLSISVGAEVKPEIKSKRWSAEVGIWRANLHGSGLTVGSFSSDVVNDFGIGESTSPYLKLNYKLSDRWALGLEYFSHSFNGTTTSRINLMFPYTQSGYTHIVINGTYTLNSSLKQNAIDGWASYKLLRGKTGYLVGLVGIRYLYLKVKGDFTGNFNVDFYNGSALVGSTAGQTYLQASYSVDGPIPYLGIYGQWKLSKDFSLSLGFKGISYSGNNTNASFSDLMVGIDWNLGKSSSLRISYKDQELNYKDSDGRKVVLSTKGPVLSYTWKF